MEESKLLKLRYFSEPEKTRRRIEAAIVASAQKDVDFRKDLLTDPRIAIARLTGFLLRSNLEIRVLEESRDKVYIVLPYVSDRTSADQSAEVSESIEEGSIEHTHAIHTNAFLCGGPVDCSVPKHGRWATVYEHRDFGMPCRVLLEGVHTFAGGSGISSIVVGWHARIHVSTSVDGTGGKWYEKNQGVNYVGDDYNDQIRYIHVVRVD